MLLDHIAIIFFPQNMILRGLGRLAFPLFAYFLSIGFDKTSNKLNYFLRLLIFALISQIPAFYFNSQLIFYPYRLNILFTLSIGLIVLFSYIKFEYYYKKFKHQQRLKELFKSLLFISIIIIIITTIIFIQLNFGFIIDYEYYGVLLPLIFYIFKKNYTNLLYSFTFLFFIKTYINYFIYYLGKNNSITESIINARLLIISYFHEIPNLFNTKNPFFQFISIFSILLIYLHSKLNFRLEINRGLFYIFYPLHLIILILIKHIITNI
jgi:hypothetical protein